MIDYRERLNAMVVNLHFILMATFLR